ncbi:LPXTG-motif cell wall anchor domain-containing protein [Pilibacter termitis]|uniref:LPXTG-motif cell wall anchor domain-containing protein n=1 Tax=Pilibacter termitis TaxID=263852 RepID=A0A1T4QER6_9ENTE|nr:MucBP domain-containing protein [Pilibacter termitis]SKA02293.1 LPXTG-motif cell wall anchor domain-containing protein [Pilibacter termitis]
MPTNGLFVADVLDPNFSVELDETNAPVLVGTVSATTTDFVVTMYAYNASGDAKINFIDDAGKPVVGAPIATMGGQVGDAFSYDPPAIPGYVYNGGTVNGVLTDTLQVIDVVYTRVETKVTVSYVNEQGEKLQDDSVFTGKFGEVSSFKAPEISGYDLIQKDGENFTSTSKEIAVKHGESDQQVTLVYRNQVATTPVTPVPTPEPTPVTSTTEESKADQKEELPKTGTQETTTTQTTQNKAATPAKETALPKTGEKSNIALLAVGTAFVAMAAFVFKKKRETKEV